MSTTLAIKENSIKIIQNLTGHTNGVTSLVVLPNGLLASGSYNKNLEFKH
jgi:hypothetical protein